MAEIIKTLIGGELDVASIDKVLADTTIIVERNIGAVTKTQSEINQEQDAFNTTINNRINALTDLVGTGEDETPAVLYKWIPIDVIQVEPPTPDPEDYVLGEGNSMNGWVRVALGTENGKYLWQSNNTLLIIDGEYSFKNAEWSSPVRISGEKGDKGDDALEREWIYIGKSQETVFSEDNHNHPKDIVNGTIPDEDNPGSRKNQQYDNKLEDWVPEGWSDNAIAIDDTDNLYVYASWRDYNKLTKIWEPFHIPILWSNWGQTGLDGDGVLYIFKLFDHKLSEDQVDDNGNIILEGEVTTLRPNVPEANAEGEFIPTGWSDDPISPDFNDLYCYCATIKRIRNVWQTEFSKLSLWSKWVNDGKSVLAKYSVGPKNIGDPEDEWDWDDNFDFDKGHKWMKTSKDNGNSWTKAMRIVGEKGDETRFDFAISAHQTAEIVGNCPSDILDSDWEDTPMSTTVNKPYLWSRVTNPNGDVSYIRLTGERGPSGLVSLISTMFVRLNETPQTIAQNAGSYSNPSPDNCKAGEILDENENILNIYWLDSIPDGEAMLWETRRTFTNDGEPPQDTKWSTPRKVEDTQYLDIEFAKVYYNGEVEDTPPTPNSGNRHKDGHDFGHSDQIWFDPVKDKYDSSNHLRNFSEMVWRAERKIHNGAYVGEWVITRIKGEQGIAATIEINEDGYWVINGKLLKDKNGNPVKAEGENGAGVQISGVVALRTDLTIINDKGYALPKGTSETIEVSSGDCYICESDRHLYIFIETVPEWRDLGEFKGLPGDRAYMHVAYALSSPVNVTVNNVNTIGFTVDSNGLDYDWWGFCCNNEEYDPGSDWNELTDSLEDLEKKKNIVNSYAWKYMKGAPGENVARLDIDNEYDVVRTDSTCKVLKNAEVITTIRLFDGASEVDISGRESFDISGIVTTGDGAVATFSMSPSGKGKKLIWTFLENAIINEHYNITIGCKYNEITYKAVFSILASKGQPIFLLVPSYSSLPCIINADNQLSNPPVLSLIVNVLGDGDPINISEYDSNGCITYGENNYYVRYSLENMPIDKEDEMPWPEENSVQAQSSTNNVYIAIFNSENIILDRETIPVIKDGDSIKSITKEYNVSAYEADDVAGDGLDYPSDITEWFDYSPPVNDDYPYLWTKETISYIHKETATIFYYCVGKKGDRGIDALDVEWAYVRTTKMVLPEIVPEEGNGYLEYDYKPLAKVSEGRIKGNNGNEGNAGDSIRCTDDPKGVNSEWKYEWEIKRHKIIDPNTNKGSWAPYSGKMTLHNNYAESPLIIDIDNDSDLFGVDVDGLVIDELTKTTVVRMFYGLTKQVFSEGYPKVELYDNNNNKITDTNIVENRITEVVDSERTEFKISVIIKANESTYWANKTLYAKIIGKCSRGEELSINFTIGRVDGAEDGVSPVIYLLKPSIKCFSFDRNFDNTFRKLSIESTIRIIKTIGNSAEEVTDGDNIKFKWRFNDQPLWKSVNGSELFSSGSKVKVTDEDAVTYSSVLLQLFLQKEGEEGYSPYPEIESLPIVRGGASGTNGSSPISAFRWYKKGETVSKPTDTSSETPEATTNENANPVSSWSKYPPNREDMEGWELWMINSTKYSNIDANGDIVYSISDWSSPVRISGPEGTPGEDADDREWIYRRYEGEQNWDSSEAIKPNYSSWTDINNIEHQYSNDDFVPLGWQDNPQGVTSHFNFEYAWWRDKSGEETTWNPEQGTLGWYGPILWSHYGERGMDGDGVEYVFVRTKTNNAPYIDENPEEDLHGKHISDDDYCPSVSLGAESEWATDEPKGVNSEYPYEWYIMRSKKLGSDKKTRYWEGYPTGQSNGKMLLWNNYSGDTYRILFTYNSSSRALINEIIAQADYGCNLGTNEHLYFYLQRLEGSSWIDCSEYCVAIRAFNDNNTIVSGINYRRNDYFGTVESSLINNPTNIYFEVYFVKRTDAWTILNQNSTSSINNAFMSARINKIPFGTRVADLNNEMDSVIVDLSGRIPLWNNIEGNITYAEKVLTTVTLHNISTPSNFTISVTDENGTEYESGENGSIIVVYSILVSNSNTITIYFTGGTYIGNKKTFRIILTDQSNKEYVLYFPVLGINDKIYLLLPNYDLLVFNTNENDEWEPDSYKLSCKIINRNIDGSISDYSAAEESLYKVWYCEQTINTTGGYNNSPWTEFDTNPIDVSFDVTYNSILFILVPSGITNITESNIFDRETVYIVKGGRRGPRGEAPVITIVENGNGEKVWKIGDRITDVKAEGSDGNGINIQGTVAAVSDLTIVNNQGKAKLINNTIVTAENGYCYVCEENRHLYMWLDSTHTWNDLGEFQGRPGSSSYIHVAYSIGNPINVTTENVDNIGFTTKHNNENYNWFGLYVSNSPNDPGNETDWAEWGTLENGALNKKDAIDLYKWNYIKGKDGNGFEYIYLLTKDVFGSGNYPQINLTTGTGSPINDEFLPNVIIPTGHSSDYQSTTWSDDPNEDVSDTWPILWLAKRKYYDNTWHNFGTPKIHMRYNFEYRVIWYNASSSNTEIKLIASKNDFSCNFSNNEIGFKLLYKASNGSWKDVTESAKYYTAVRAFNGSNTINGSINSSTKSNGSTVNRELLNSENNRYFIVYFLETRQTNNGAISNYFVSARLDKLPSGISSYLTLSNNQEDFVYQGATLVYPRFVDTNPITEATLYTSEGKVTSGITWSICINSDGTYLPSSSSFNDKDLAKAYIDSVGKVYIADIKQDETRILIKATYKGIDYFTEFIGYKIINTENRVIGHLRINPTDIVFNKDSGTWENRNISIVYLWLNIYTGGSEEFAFTPNMIRDLNGLPGGKMKLLYGFIKSGEVYKPSNLSTLGLDDIINDDGSLISGKGFIDNTDSYKYVIEKTLFDGYDGVKFELLWKENSSSYVLDSLTVNFIKVEDGKGIASTSITYQIHSSGTTAPTGTWKSTIDATTKSYPYLWTKTVVTYTDTTSSTSYTVSRSGFDGTSVKAQYSTTNTTTASYWHDTFNTGDQWMRTSTDEGSTYGDPIRIVGEKGDGGDYIDYTFNLSTAVATATVGTAPTNDTLKIKSDIWSDAPLTPESDYPYLWMKMVQHTVSNGTDTADSPHYIRLTPSDDVVYTLESAETKVIIPSGETSKTLNTRVSLYSKVGKNEKAASSWFLFLYYKRSSDGTFVYTFTTGDNNKRTYIDIDRSVNSSYAAIGVIAHSTGGMNTSRLRTILANSSYLAKWEIPVEKEALTKDEYTPEQDIVDYYKDNLDFTVTRDENNGTVYVSAGSQSKMQIEANGGSLTFYSKDRPTFTWDNQTETNKGVALLSDIPQLPISKDDNSNLTVGTANKNTNLLGNIQIGGQDFFSNSKIKSDYLPSYVDDILEYAGVSSFPSTGETGKIYVALDTNSIYRWSGSQYVEVSPLAGAPVSSVNGKTGTVVINAYDVGLGNVGNYKAVSTVANLSLSSTELSNARANIGAADKTSLNTLGSIITKDSNGNVSVGSSGNVTIGGGGNTTIGGEGYLLLYPGDKAYYGRTASNDNEIINKGGLKSYLADVDQGSVSIRLQEGVYIEATSDATLKATDGNVNILSENNAVYIESQADEVYIDSNVGTYLGSNSGDVFLGKTASISNGLSSRVYLGTSTNANNKVATKGYVDSAIANVTNTVITTMTIVGNVDAYNNRVYFKADGPLSSYRDNAGRQIFSDPQADENLTVLVNEDSVSGDYIRIGYAFVVTTAGTIPTPELNVQLNVGDIILFKNDYPEETTDSTFKWYKL